MPFLSGAVTFERFHVSGFSCTEFSEEHLEAMKSAAAGRFQSASTENVQVGFLGGEHLFDQHLDLGKNIINDALHCAVRIDTNQVPAAIRNAWLRMELAALTADNPSRRPTKAQREEAKEAVAARCEAEAATGKFQKMQMTPLLWDLRNSSLYVGGSGASVIGHCTDLIERCFDVELSRVTAGTLAHDWARMTDNVAAIEDLTPASFAQNQNVSDLAWSNAFSSNPDFLGNEFLLWLWYTLESETDTIQLSDESEVTAMLIKTLTLECPLGEHGKETISAESPVTLPEARQAIRSGKLPRKSGMSLVRHGQQFDLVLQAEMFAVSGAKIHTDDQIAANDADERIDNIRQLAETVDLLFHAFCAQRVSEEWPQLRVAIRDWLENEEAAECLPAA